MAEDQTQQENAAPGEEAGAQSANDNTASMEQALEKLYDRLPKVIARIAENNGKEAEAALSSLFAHFRKINELEEKLVKPGDDYKKLDLSRIYELAVSGNAGADDSVVSELQEANAQFAEQNTILSELVSSMTYQIDSMKRQAADEILATGKAKKVPLKDLKKVLASVSETIGKIEAQMAILGQPEDLQTPQKPLDERLAEGLMGLDDITADMLKISPGKPGFIGRVLRRAGFAYDHKDLVTARMLVLTVIKANKKLAEVNATLVPAKAQIENLHHMLTLVELYAGHEERQGTQYQEAHQEILRLNARLERYDIQHGSLADLEAALLGMQQTIAKYDDELNQLVIKKNKIRQDIYNLNDVYTERYNSLRTPEENPSDNPAKSSGRKTGKQFLAEKAAAAGIQPEAPITAHKSDRQNNASGVQNDAHIKALGENLALLATIKSLTAKIADLQDAHNQKNQKQNRELISLQNRLRMTESGLLTQKLEAEISSLVILVEGYEKQIEEEKQTRFAFEERVETWVQNEETLQTKIESLRKKLAVKAVFAAAALGTAAFAGYASTALFNTGLPPLAGYFTVVTTIPAAVNVVIGGFRRVNFGLKAGCVDALKGLAVGAFIGAIGIVPLSIEKATLEKPKQAEAEQIVEKPAAIPAAPTTRANNSGRELLLRK